MKKLMIAAAALCAAFQAAAGGEPLRCRLRIDASAAPDLAGWAEKALAPTLREWLKRLAGPPDGLLVTDGWTCPREIVFRFAAGGGRAIRSVGGREAVLGAQWIRNNRNGEAEGVALFALVTVLQGYGAASDNCPEWAARGIADYVRWYLFEPQSRKEDPSEKARTVNRKGDSKSAASFLDFVEKAHPGTIKKLHAALSGHVYDEDRFWKDATGSSVCRLELDWMRKTMFDSGWSRVVFDRVKGVELSVMFGPYEFGDKDEAFMWLYDNFMPACIAPIEKARDALSAGVETPLKEVAFVLGSGFGTEGDDERMVVSVGRDQVEDGGDSPWYASQIAGSLARRMVAPGGACGDGRPDWLMDSLASYVPSRVCGLGSPDMEFLDQDGFVRTLGGSSGASFLEYVEKRFPGTFARLVRELRDNTFDDAKFWDDATGVPPETLESEWTEQVLNDFGNGMVEVAAGEFALSYDCTRCKSLVRWVRERLAPAASQWTPRFAGMLSPEDRTGRKSFKFRFGNHDNVMQFHDDGSVTFDIEWFKQNRDGEAAGAALFAVVRLLQGYGDDACPEWLATGIADYCRWVVFEGRPGKCDEAARSQWGGASHDGAYKITASFLDFVEKAHPGTVRRIDAAIRKGTFDDAKTWAEITGKTAKELEKEWTASIATTRRK